MKFIRLQFGSHLHRISRMLLLTLSLVISTTANANQPFYFIAKQAPEGSLALQGNNAKVVYLRWDLLEGELPGDITQFNLYRDGTLIGQYPANQLLSESEASRLYQGSAQNRRLIETMSLLKEESVLDANAEDINVNDYAYEIISRINKDNYWAQLASRRDFNIAIIRNRGAIDNPGSGQFSYELKAVNGNAEMRRVGLVTIDTRQDQALLPVPEFDQLTLSQCDLPDIKDHFSVALNWAAIGEDNAADRIANQLFVGGYDIYRSKDNLDSSVTSAPTRNLANEASLLGFDNQGQVAFSDLERINDTLITVAADFDSTSPEWLETQAVLARAGLKPGDKRAYYLVPRDFTGNFGPTIGTIVTIGDLSRPPAPWDIDVYLSEERQRVELSFEQIDADSYLESFGNDKRVCAISDTGVISFVGREQSCAEHPHQMLQTQIAQYKLYRFDNFADASKFKDSDGDGFADSIERPTNTQCKAASTSGGNLVNASFVSQAYDTHTRIIVSDDTPAQQKGAIYWYRLASQSPSGRLSFLSEPVRVNFPDRSLPESPNVSLTYPGDGTESCGCEIEYQPSSKPWSFQADSDTGNSLMFACNGTNYTVSPKDILNANSSACSNSFPQGNMAADCDSGGVISSTTTSYQCEAAIPQNADFCGTGSMSFKTIPCEEVPAPAGVIKGPLTITVTPKDAEQCVSLYQQVAGSSIKISTSCGEADSSDVHVVESGEFCGYAVSHDVNNNISSAERIDCRQVVPANDDRPVIAPKISAVQLSQNFASIDVSLPTQNQTILEIELYQALPVRGETIVSREGVASNTDNKAKVNIDIPALTGATDQWCTRARIYGVGDIDGSPRLSQWSAERCETRSSSAATVPKWLSWPGLKRANQKDDLTVKSNTDFGFLPSGSPIQSGVHIPLLSMTNVCRADPNSITLFGEITQSPPDQGSALVNLDCNPAGKMVTSGAYSEKLNFIVFRQSREDGVISNFKQVSPLIDYIHWQQTVDAKNGTRYVLRDPYIWPSVADISNTDQLTLSYVDRAPLVSGREYRYQLVYFDQDHSLAAWRQTQWISVTAASSSAAQLIKGNM